MKVSAPSIYHSDVSREEPTFSRVLIAIPSLGRPQAILKKTFALVNGAGIPFKVFVEPQEAFHYRYFCGKDNVIVLPLSGMGIGYSRNRMREYAKAHDYEFIYEIDDDVEELVRLDSNDKQKSLRLCICDFVTAMDRFAKLGGIRVLQYRFWLYTKKDIHKWVEFNHHLIWASFMRTSAIVPMSDKFTHFEDMATSILLMRNGFFTLTYGLAGGKVLQNQGKGGCQIGDRQQSAINSIIELQKEFPHIYQTASKSYFGVNINVDYYDRLYQRHTIRINSDDELQEYLACNNYPDKIYITS